MSDLIEQVARKKTVRNAIMNELSFLQDNRYRYQHFVDEGWISPTGVSKDSIIASHDKKIAALKQALEEL